jgi:ferric-dicitrate binding protein FerR (iron transport regulator)
MATVSPMPFAIAMVASIGLLAAWLDLAIAESRRPLRARTFARGRAADASAARVARRLPFAWPDTGGLAPLPALPERARAERSPPSRVRVAPVRVAVVVGAFALWSVWSTARRLHVGSGTDARRHH